MKSTEVKKMEAMEKYSAVNAMTGIDLMYNLKKNINFGELPMLGKKSDTELRGMLYDNISTAQLKATGLLKMDESSNFSQLRYVAVPDVNLFRTFNVGARRLDGIV